MSNTSKGFSLVELLLAAAIAGLLAAIAFPSFAQWRQNLQYREAARGIASALRDARQRAVTTNREHRVEFDVDGRRYRIRQGNKADGSAWTDATTTTIKDWTILPQGVNLMKNKTCNKNDDVNIEFNPNGRSNSQYVCVMGANNDKQYLVGIPSATTGRAKIARWGGADWI